MTRTFHLRPAEASDADTIAALHAASWRSAYRDLLSDDYFDRVAGADRQRLWRERFASVPPARRLVLLAEQKGVAVGFVCVLCDADPPWGPRLDDLHVLPGYAGAGIGRALMLAAARWCGRAAPGAPLHLLVYAANAGARRFYAALGGEEAEQFDEHTADGGCALAVRVLWRDQRRIVLSRSGPGPTRAPRRGWSPRPRRAP